MQYDPPLVLLQLTYSGVFEAITIRKQGFPFRYTHEQFRKRFKCIMPKKTWPNDKGTILLYCFCMCQCNRSIVGLGVLTYLCLCMCVCVRVFVMNVPQLLVWS